MVVKAAAVGCPHPAVQLVVLVALPAMVLAAALPLLSNDHWPEVVAVQAAAAAVLVEL
jgi:hypothetical protein